VVTNRFCLSVWYILGYELINEPWAGDIYEDPTRLLPHTTEKKYLQPLYEHLHKAIRSVDDEKMYVQDFFSFLYINVLRLIFNIFLAPIQNFFTEFFSKD